MAITGTDFVFELRSALKRLGDESAGFLESQDGDPVPGSQAATELAVYPRAESLYTVTAIGTMLLEFVAEHVSVLVKAMTEPVETIACWTCVRSMLESSAIAAWLFDPRIDAQKRVGRAYAYRYEGLEQQEKLGRAMGFPAPEMKKVEGPDQARHVAGLPGPDHPARCLWQVGVLAPFRCRARILYHEERRRRQCLGTRWRILRTGIQRLPGISPHGRDHRGADSNRGINKSSHPWWPDLAF